MNINILGTGAYGIALSKILVANNHKITLWTKFQEEVDTLLLKRENIRLLPGVIIDEQVNITSDIKSVDTCDMIVIAVPTNAVREVCNNLKGHITNQIICIVTKGIEIDTYKRMSEIVKEVLDTNKIVVLSGPSFAIELGNFNELGYTCAGLDNELVEIVKNVFESKNIVVQVTKDVAGVEICASSKNVFAIIMGMMDKCSDSTKATMLTVLLNDLRLVCQIFGGAEDTIFKFAGIGDFLLTCMNQKSRNYTFGKLIAENNTKDECFEIMNITTVEGLYSLDSIYNMLKDKKIDIKSITTLYNILYNGMDNKEIMNCFR